jgi:hypothetical protein
MPISPEQIQLARDFEPVLYFTVGERFLPADPKRYLEASSLWRVRPPGTTPDEWGEEAAGEWPKHPMAKAKKVVGLKTEAHDDVTWLGDLLPAPGSGEDRFLSLTGWVDGVRPGVDTETRFADVDGMLAAYSGNPTLGQSQPWYYADVLDAAQIAALANDPPPGLSPALAQKLIGLLDQPTLILYHLFFPAHREELAGCAQVDNGALFGTFAGEWSCVAILLENGRPTHLGLSQRNAGSRDPMDDGTRLGMVVTRWDRVPVIAGFENHPQVAVAAGTHSLYADLDSGGEVSPPSFTSAAPDPSSGSCGDVEQVEALTPPPAPTLTWEPPTDWELALKCIVPVVGWFWAGLELSIFSEPFGVAEVTTANPRDVPPTRNDHGAVVAPSAVPEPAAQHWPTDGVTDPSQFHSDGGRTYPFVVDRAEQAWWPRPDGDGFHGRWGPAVASDPFGRRAGMRVPEFAKLFLGALSQT